MINIYPANRLENLVFLLQRVMQTGNNSHILSEEIILVQSKGMQHWLSLKLAESRGISMNLSFSLPVQFFWNQIRLVLGSENVPEQSSYTREVLSWRLYELLSSDAVINNPLCQEASDYWLGRSEQDSGDNDKSGSEDKRFQLACQIADLFEQYLIFRPDWLLSWERGEEVTHWQAYLWQLLVQQDPLHPIRLLKQSIQALKDDGHHEFHLPQRISLFGINTLPPLWLEFLSELGQHVQIHFFHLNPCIEYWGDLKTDKAQAKEQFYRWLKCQDLSVVEAADPALSNPLLANLGAQGKDFLFLLQEHTSIEIPVYESPEDRSLESAKAVTVLEHIQTDILKLHDARTSSQAKHTEALIDDSISINSAHSVLREIQALHDWLLHQLNDDKTLTPKDILVMCPNIENYAPYVDAVFAHGWNDWSEKVPPLPCSIADRTLKDSEPLVQAFIDLLDLPDSRFQVSQILSYLRLPALQDKFSFAEDDLLILERWMNHAAIHWGLDADHKQRILSGNAVTNDMFTWKQGLERLLLGFAHSDQASLYQQQLLLPDVEGDDALLLGRYFELLEQLQYCARELQSARTPEQWTQFLQQTKESLFSTLTVDNNAQQIIQQAIDDLSEYTSQAEYNNKIPLTVIRDYLLNHFNQPEPGRQFMTGQVTFCSMVPMRSIPFRVIAVLGLNDGEFPRQRQPIGFDLMAMEPPRKGDRSRRGDDRYLFLEAIISCRDKFYLSYQGHDIKTNNTREPSLVLQEFMDYLEKAYGWQLSSGSENLSSRTGQLFNVPMQAFSRLNYQGKWPSFNANWLKLSDTSLPRSNLQTIDADLAKNEDELIVSVEQLVQFFDNPCRQFAQNCLGLYFEDPSAMTPEDSEPFISNHLDRYLIQEAIIKTALSDDADEQTMNELILGFKRSGTLPDTPNAEEELTNWQEQAVEFAAHIESVMQDQQITIKPVTCTIAGVQINAELPMLGEQLFFWRLASPKGKDDIRLWIYHLVAQIVSENVRTQGIFRGPVDKKTAQHSILNIYFEPLKADAAESAENILSELIQCWKEGMQQPLLLNATLGQKHCYIKINAKKQAVNKPLTDFSFAAFWQDNFLMQGLGSDPYVHWFWGDSSQEPPWESCWQQRIERVYKPLYTNRQEILIHE